MWWLIPNFRTVSIFVMLVPPPAITAQVHVSKKKMSTCKPNVSISIYNVQQPATPQPSSWYWIVSSCTNFAVFASKFAMPVPMNVKSMRKWVWNIAACAPRLVENVQQLVKKCRYVPDLQVNGQKLDLHNIATVGSAVSFCHIQSGNVKLVTVLLGRKASTFFKQLAEWFHVVISWVEHNFQYALVGLCQ